MAVIYIAKPSPNFGYPRGTHGQNHPLVIVWHITASRPTTPPLVGLDSHFQNPDAYASTQLGIQDREVHKYVDYRDACWGQGLLDRPDLSNPHIMRWLRLGINPNTESIGIEVVSLAGPDRVASGIHRLNDETWETMQLVGRDLVEEFPDIEAIAIDQLGHGQIDSVNRSRDPFTRYLPTDILVPEEEEEDEMQPPLYPVKLATQQSWAVDGHGFVARLHNPDDVKEMKRIGLLVDEPSAVVDPETMEGLGVPSRELP